MPAVQMLGDRWSLLILRDMMLRGHRTHKEILRCDEGIARAKAKAATKRQRQHVARQDDAGAPHSAR